MNNVLLVTVLHGRYNLHEERNMQSLGRFLVLCSLAVIKDVVEEEEEMWSTLTGKIKLHAGGRERVSLCSYTSVHLSVSLSR